MNTKLLFLLLFLFSKAYSQQKPNIIFIMADDLGYGDLGSYGQQVIQTPNLDQMAKEGMRFTHCYAGSPVCAPSRSTLMTGKHTGHTTVRGNFGKTGVVGLGGGMGRVPLKAEDFTVAEMMKEAGYKTGMSGKWGLGEPNTSGHPNLQGFDEFFGYLNQRRAHEYFTEYLWHNDKKIILEGNKDGKQKDYSHTYIHDFAMDFVKENADTSFFLYLPYTIPHDKYQIPSTAPYSEENWEKDEKVHAAMVTLMDKNIGELFSLLKELKIDENTLVFFCSDNGAAQRWEGRFNSSGSLKGRKRDMYEGGIRTPMIVRWPDKIKGGTTNNTPWYFPDFFPTLAELTKQNIPADLDGKSILPALYGKKVRFKKRFLYWEFHERGFQQAVRWGDWKAIRLEKGGPLELYHLKKDPAESRNIADKKPGIVERMENYLSGARTESVDWPMGGR